MIRRSLNGETHLLRQVPYELRTERTQGSKTFQYLEENKTIVISLVAASENERAQTYCRKTVGVVRQERRIYTREVTK